MSREVFPKYSLCTRSPYPLNMPFYNTYGNKKIYMWSPLQFMQLLLCCCCFYCTYNLCYMQCCFTHEICLYFYISAFWSMCAGPNVFFFFVNSWFFAVLVCQWVILGWFHLPPLLLVSFCFHLPRALNFYYVVFIFQNLLGIFS